MFAARRCLLNYWKKKVWKEFIASPGVYKLTNCNCVFTFTNILNIVVVFINESKQEGGVDISHNIFAFENLKSIKITQSVDLAAFKGKASFAM